MKKYLLLTLLSACYFFNAHAQQDTINNNWIKQDSLFIARVINAYKTKPASIEQLLSYRGNKKEKLGFGYYQVDGSNGKGYASFFYTLIYYNNQLKAFDITAQLPADNRLLERYLGFYVPLFTFNNKGDALANRYSDPLYFGYDEMTKLLGPKSDIKIADRQLLFYVTPFSGTMYGGNNPVLDNRVVYRKIKKLLTPEICELLLYSKNPATRLTAIEFYDQNLRLFTLQKVRMDARIKTIYAELPDVETVSDDLGIIEKAAQLVKQQVSFLQWLREAKPMGKRWSLPLPDDDQLMMFWIPPGTFTMGSPATEVGHKADESPQTRVTLTKGYWLASKELTVGEWEAITGQSLREKVIKMLNDETLYDFDGKKMRIRDFMHFDKNSINKIMANEYDDLPMYFVSWNEAMAFCHKLTELERARGRLPAGYEYNLPTEAQWEYACRAGTTGATYYEVTATDTGMDKIAWYGKNSFQGYDGRGFGNPKAGPRFVRGKLPNKWGLWDMSGNIWEWCRDWYGPYLGGSVTDPLGPATGTYKVNRGGSFGSGLYDERSANRAQNPPNEDSAYRGFRIALCPVQ